MNARTVAVALVQLVLVAAFLAGGVRTAKHLLATRVQAGKVEKTVLPTLVETRPVTVADATVVITAMGTVIPTHEVTLFPEVTGRVVEAASSLVPGGWIDEGSMVVRVDVRDYRLALEQQEAAVERARFEFKIEEGRQVVARREWALMGGETGTDQSSRDLALRLPHLVNAQAGVASALSGLERARLNVERTTVKAPFNAVVVEEFVDLGQVVTPQSKIARLVGRDKFWIRVALPVERLSAFTLPSANGQGGARAKVVQDTGNGHPIVREGTVVRLLSDIDPAGRLARVLVAVDRPLEGPGLPLLLGAYVRVDIQGHPLPAVVAVPRAALHGDSSVWIMTSTDELEIRPVAIAWRRTDDVLVAKGLTEGERLVTSRISSPLPGMKLRTEG